MTKERQPKKARAYYFLILLWCSILLGAFLGVFLGEAAVKLKPLGDIFLNLLFTLVVPLVFFSVSSALASTGDFKKLGRIMMAMLVIFLGTGLFAAIFMLVAVKLFPPAGALLQPLGLSMNTPTINIAEQIVGIFTVPDFIKLFSRENMLALIVFSALVGLATAGAGERGKSFLLFLQGGTAIFMKAISLVMYYAPVGFFAYFAVLAGQLGPALFKTYYQVTLLYYLSGLLYFVFAFTGYAYLAGKREGVSLFWKNSFLPAMTALATCSSAASIPANLQATEKMKVPLRIYELVVPLGSILHKDGSVLGGMVKISFLFAVFQLPFAAPSVLLMAILVSLLVGTVMGAIPSGGMVGEMLILSVYGFPPQALMAIAAISLLIDPLATLLNVLGNTVCSLLVARFVEGPKWLPAKSS